MVYIGLMNELCLSGRTNVHSLVPRLTGKEEKESLCTRLDMNMTRICGVVVRLGLLCTEDMSEYLTYTYEKMLKVGGAARRAAQDIIKLHTKNIQKLCYNTIVPNKLSHL